MRLAVGIQIKVQMPHCDDALLRALAATGAKRIGSHIDIPAGRVLLRKPAEVTRRKRGLQLDNPL